jgi:hypothetical protein
LTNNAANDLLARLIDLETLQTQFGHDGKVKLMQAMFHPQGIRPFVVNWENVAGHLLQRVYQEAMRPLSKRGRKLGLVQSRGIQTKINISKTNFFLWLLLYLPTCRPLSYPVNCV